VREQAAREPLADGAEADQGDPKAACHLLSP
jgi:hypothetical protein